MMKSSEKQEEIKFSKNLDIWKDGIEFAKERIIEFYDKEKTSDDVSYITLKTVGEKYSKKLANIMFELGYGEWVFNDPGTLEKMQEQIIDILEDDKELKDILKNRNLNREQLYSQIKNDFLESELANYLEDNYIDIGLIPNEIKENMVTEIRKGMLENYSYKYIIWDSGDLERLIEILPEECFVTDHKEKNIEIEGEEL